MFILLKSKNIHDVFGIVIYLEYTDYRYTRLSYDCTVAMFAYFMKCGFKLTFLDSIIFEIREL